MICEECARLKNVKEEFWQAYQRQKHLNNSGLFQELKSNAEIDLPLDEYKITSARLRYHLAIKHTDQGHRVSKADQRLLDDENGPVSC
jgi:hypothetical protein